MTRPLKNPMTKAQAGALGGMKRKGSQLSGSETTTPTPPSKRRNASTGPAKAPVRADKKARGMLHEYLLPDCDKPEFIPESLPNIQIPDGDVQLPVVLVSKGGETFQITNRQTPSDDWKEFWELARGRVAQLMQTWQDEDFGTVLTGTTQSSANFSLHSALFPTMFARFAPVLAYDNPLTKAKHMNKEAFKVFLFRIQNNAERLLDETKDTTIEPALQTQRQEPGEITSRLLSVMPATTISAEEHNHVVRNIITSTSDAAEIVRRELCCYGVAVHTVAGKAVDNLAQLRTIGGYLLDILNPGHKAKGKEIEKAPGEEREIKVEDDLGQKVTFDNFYMVEKEPGASDGGQSGASTPQPEAPEHKPVNTLPLLLVRTLTKDDAHQCRCPEVCEPDFQENLLQQATDKLRHEMGEEVKGEVKRELWDSFAKELAPAVKEAAQREMEKQALAAAKDEKAKEERRSLETRIRQELTAEITTTLQNEYANRVAAGVKEKMDAMYRHIGVPPPQATEATQASEAA